MPGAEVTRGLHDASLATTMGSPHRTELGLLGDEAQGSGIKPLDRRGNDGRPIDPQRDILNAYDRPVECHSQRSRWRQRPRPQVHLESIATIVERTGCVSVKDKSLLHTWVNLIAEVGTAVSGCRHFEQHTVVHAEDRIDAMRVSLTAQYAARTRPNADINAASPHPLGDTCTTTLMKNPTVNCSSTHIDRQGVIPEDLGVLIQERSI